MKFKDRDIEAFWNDPDRNIPVRIPPELRRMLYRKLQILDAAYTINDLRIPPGNRLERLKGDRAKQWSIRVNKQWRLCFIWNEHEAERIEFNDYHE
ncbi:MAG: type II toxin-antitoxin system RelE/ParE family toxin [Coriobacteriales bacterium]|jgi:proteic killer suppression protein|nr:type II toxin-antitoxin system RelE/ParE family toxin [Coriobacteriales bacterium]